MKTLMLASVRFYRNWISPVLPGSCRFAPTCSTYAQQALEHHGAWKGALLTIRRLLRCHPFHPGGYDPVPKIAVSEYRGAGVSGTKPEPAKQNGNSQFQGSTLLTMRDKTYGYMFSTNTPLYPYPHTHDRAGQIVARPSKP